MSAELPQTKDWTVRAVREGAVEDNPNGPGQLQKFYVDFEGCDDVYWRRKLPATVEVGQSYYGTISKGTYGPIFKKEKPGAGASTTSAASANHGWKSGGGDAETTARIGRAHAQEMAIRSLVAMGSFETKDANQLHRHLRTWTDWFAEDVDQAGEKAAQGGSGGVMSNPSAQGASPAPPAQLSAPTSDLAEDDRSYIGVLLSTVGLSAYPAQRLADLVVADFTPQQLVAVKRQLEDFQTQADALRRLTNYWEKSQGEPLPEVDPADDLPF